jgi:hypothetical protein
VDGALEELAMAVTKPFWLQNEEGEAVRVSTRSTR